MPRLNHLSSNPEDIARAWYVPPHLRKQAGWILYSEDFVLRTIQGCHDSPDALKRTAGWRFLATVIRLVIAIAQLILMGLSRIPLCSGFLYWVVCGAPRNAAGFFLRGCYWKSQLAHLGVDTLIDQGVDIRRPHRVRIGDHCHIDRGVLLSVGNDQGYITIGDCSFLGTGCHIAGRGGVSLGHFVGVAANVHLYSVTNNPIHPERPGELISMSHMAPHAQQYTTTAPISVGDYAIIGFCSLILPGTTIGRGSVVHAFAEVRGDFPAFAILSGHGRSRRQGWRRPSALDARLTEGDNGSNDLSPNPR